MPDYLNIGLCIYIIQVLHIHVYLHIISHGYCNYVFHWRYMYTHRSPYFRDKMYNFLFVHTLYVYT